MVLLCLWLLLVVARVWTSQPQPPAQPLVTDIQEAPGEDERMMKINELLRMIENQEKAGGESCTPGNNFLYEKYFIKKSN